MIIWLAESQTPGFSRKDRVGINEHGVVVGQSVLFPSGRLDAEVMLRKRADGDCELWSDIDWLRICASVYMVARRLATEHEVTEALDEFLQREIDLPYVRMEPDEIFAALPEWTRINTLDWAPEGVER